MLSDENVSVFIIIVSMANDVVRGKMAKMIDFA